MKKLRFLTAFSIISVIFFSCNQQGKYKENVTEDIENNNNGIEIQLIRNATVLVSFKNTKILVDPILSDVGTEPPMPFSNQNKNPMIPLPVNKDDLIDDVNAILLTHYHADHFDSGAEKDLPKDILIFCQPGDDKKLVEKGFLNLQVIDSVYNWDGIIISRYLASHHIGATGEPPFGESSSFLIQTKKESLFFTGDAIWDERLQESMTSTQPKLIVANAGECTFTEENPILAPGILMTLTTNELKQITKALPNAKILAVHMDAINHCGLAKKELREYIDEEKLTKNIFVPNEGEVISYKQITKTKFL